MEEGWVGKSQNKVQGVMFRYDPANDKYTRLKDVPDKDVLVRVEGCWQEQIYYSIPSSPTVKEQDGVTDPTKSRQLLIDLVPLMPVPKIVPPETEQLPNESRRFWYDVTDSILSKRFADATRIKQEIEQKQRDKAKSREEKNEPFEPRFFVEATTKSGKPELTEDGAKTLDKMQRLEFELVDGEGRMNGNAA
jgi:oxysterol-binding protein-related protein 9/10/11